MTIHHTQIKLAAKLGGTLAESANNKGVFIATLGAQTFMGTTPKEALDKLVFAAADNMEPGRGTVTPAKSAPKVIKASEMATSPMAQAAKEIKKPAKAPKKPKKAAKKRKSDDGDEGDDEGEEAEGKGSVVKAKYKKKYHPTHDTNGDEFTEAFRTATLEDPDDAKSSIDVNKLAHVARENGLSIKQWLHLKRKDGGLNVGMIRMNLGNVLRGRYRNGTDVVIGEQTLKGLPQKEKPAKVKKAAKAKKGSAT